MPDKDAGVRIPVLATAAAVWRFMALHPGAVLRVGWLPVLASVVTSGISLTTSLGYGKTIATGFAVFALVIVAMVAWQRMVLFGPESRKGWLTFRLGRAELLAILHFPLVAYLFVPWQMPAMIEWLINAPVAANFSALLPWVGFAILVFPGGLILSRAALMLAAFTAAGSARASLIETGDRVWRLSTYNSFRLWILLILATLPLTAVSVGLAALGTESDFLPPWAAAALSGGFVTLYLFTASGVCAEAWRALGAMEVPPAQKPAAKPAAKKQKRKQKP